MPKLTAYIMLLLAGVQAWLCTYALWLPWAVWMPALFFLNGCVFTLLLIKQPALQVAVNASALLRPWKWLLLLIGTIYSYQLARIILDKTPVSIEHADMLPIIQVMGKRFLHGDWHKVYAPIAEIWNGIQPIYLPAMWLPFTLADLLHFDPRWVTVGGVWIAVIGIVWQLKYLRSVGVWLVLAIICMVLWWLHTETRNNLFRLTEEGVVIAYHVLLVFTIAARKPVLLGLALSACLLSRYVLVTAIPAVLLWWVLHKEWRLLLKTAVTVLICCLLTILCFGVTPFEQMLRIPATYVEHAARVWQEHPEYFRYTTGLAALFGPDKIVLQHQLLLIMGFALPLLFAGWMFWGNQQRLLPNAEMAIATLAITVFYALVDVPYLYLYYTPVFWYLAIAVLALRQVKSSWL
jgi:hypothetical protein